MHPDVFPFPAAVAVVGGNAAALNAAVILGRAGRRVVLFDDGDGGGHDHHVPAGPDQDDPALDGHSPTAVRWLAREHLAFFGVRIRSGPVIAVGGADGGFGLLGSGGWVRARKLLLATGPIVGHDRDRDHGLSPNPGLDNGRAIDRAEPFVATSARQRSPLVDDLGCALAADGHVLVDAGGRTTVPGVYAAGEMAAASATAASRTVAGAIVDDLARQDAAARVAVSHLTRPLVEFPAVVGPAR